MTWADIIALALPAIWLVTGWGQEVARAGRCSTSHTVPTCALVGCAGGRRRLRL